MGELRNLVKGVQSCLRGPGREPRRQKRGRGGGEFEAIVRHYFCHSARTYAGSVPGEGVAKSLEEGLGRV